MHSALLFIVVCALFTATVHGDLLIADHPVSQEVNATGVLVTLECTATSDGEITHWLHDGAVIDASVDSGVEITFSGGNGAGSSSSMLAITSYETNRAGDYRCVARSLSSESLVEVSHGVILSHFTQRTFTTQPQDFTVYVIFNNEDPTPSREAAAFNCEFAALPRYGVRPVILWEFESTSSGATSILDLTGSSERSTFQYDHIAYFQLHRPTDADNGSRVRCVARHPQDASQQVTSEWASIVISNSSRPDDFPVFTTVVPSQVHRIEGQQLVLGCSISTPVTSVGLQWLGGNNLPFFTAGTQFILLRNDVAPYGASNVRVPDASIDGVTGEVFTCRATLGVGEEIKTVTVVSEPGPLPPLSYNDQLASFTIDYGIPYLDLNLNNTMANYSGRVKWFASGVPVPSPSASTQKYSVSPDMLSLMVYNINLNDTGLYQAELLDFEPAPQFITFQINVRGGKAFVSGGEPEIAVERGLSSVSLSCPTEGSFPAVTSYVWSRNGQEITIDGSKYSTSGDGNLTISNLELNDAGTYSCSPVNALGTLNSTSTRLDVSVIISVNWTVDFDYQLAEGATDVTCISSLPSGLSVSPQGLLSLANPRLNLAGRYHCQLSSQYDGYIFIELQVQGFSPDTPSIGTVKVVQETGIMVNWTAPFDPLRPVDNYTLEIRRYEREDDSDNEEEEDEEETGSQETTSSRGCDDPLPDGDVTTEVLHIIGGAEKYIIANADFSYVYRFRIQASNAIGRSTFSDEVCFELGVESMAEPGRAGGLAGWEIALIVIFILLLLLLCCVLCLCLFLCWRKEKRTYYAAKREKEDGKEFEAYRATGDEPDSKD